MPGFRFGWDGSEQKRAPGARRGFCDPVAMDDRRTDLWLIQPNNDLQQLPVRRSCRRQHTTESQGAGRKCLTRSSGERMVADTKWISAMHQSASKSTPATRLSRFL